MSAEIKPIREGLNPASGALPNPGIVEELEKLLAEAKVGNIVGLAFASVDSQNRIRTRAVWNDGGPRYPLVAACSFLWHDMMDDDK